MKRKLFASVVTGFALTAAMACGVMAKDYKVGIIQFVDDASLNQIEEAIEARLAEASEDGENTYTCQLQNGQADGTLLSQIAAQMIADEVDVIVPIATPAAQIVQTATADNQIPVVFSAVSDPVGAGLAENTTGI